MNTSPRHFARYKKEEVLIIGYNVGLNEAMICVLAGLPVQDQSELRRVAFSPEGQRIDYLVNMIKTMRHPSAQVDWFTYLWGTWSKRGLMLRVPVKDLEDMNPAQKADMKGYGSKISREKHEGRRDDPFNIGNDVENPLDAVWEPEAPKVAPTGGSSAQKASAPVDDTQTLLLTKIVEGLSNQSQQIHALTTAISSLATSSAKKKPGPKSKTATE